MTGMVRPKYPVSHENSLIVQKDDYYPGGATFNSYSTSPKNNYQYQGKEFQQELDLFDFEARMYDPYLLRTTTMDPHAENYFSLSPYSFSANNPLLFVDPTGKDINFYTWEQDDEGEWKRKQVNFSQLDENVQKALGAFAKTKAGNAYLSQFAKAGDKVGDVEFTEDGEFSKHEVGFQQFASEGSAAGTSGFGQRNGKVSFYMKINLSTSDKNPESYAVTTGHEAFIHLSQYDDRLIQAIESNDYEAYKKIAAERRAIAKDRNGGPEHDGYNENKPEYSRMKNYRNQLKNVLNPAEVNKQIQKHDKLLKTGK